MGDIEVLNHRFAIGSQVRFEKLADGVVVAAIDTSLATATISLYGGHVVNWRPKHQAEPVLWVSKLVQFKPGKAIRGGVPICWPWFGNHPTNQKLPGHGYARISPWAVAATERMSDGAIRIALAMQDSELSLAHFPPSVRLNAQITVGRELTVELTTTNEGKQDIVLTEGLHTYFKVSDVSAIQVLGLQGAPYVDLVRGNARRRQEGPIRFDGELGRIFTDSAATCVIEDPGLRRRITIEKSGSLSTAVWNPWTRVAATIPDLGVDGWRDMVCVESANALENRVTVKKGATHTHTAVYSIEAI